MNFRPRAFHDIVARLAFALLCAIALAGCASLPPPELREPVTAFAEPQATTLGRLAASAAAAPDLSGFRLLVSGEDAFGALAALADHAERSLDLQYYLVRSDASSHALMRRVLAAAHRGVRVRLLLDDLNTAGQDAGLLRLTAHPNIEVRLYNPFPAGRMSTLARVLASITDISRINQRMHNKLSVADNALAITGGRNVGDAYFVHSVQSNFVDIDIVVAGPAVRQLSASFDSFWNSPMSYPAKAVVDMDPPSAEADTPLPAAASIPSVSFAEELSRNELTLEWAPSEVFADKPIDKPIKAQGISGDVASLLRTAQKEVILISPYFVPGERGVAMARELTQRGVKLRVLTNSLASTDAPVVHIGYAHYREALLALGVELHELHPHLGAPRGIIGAFGSSQASLHAKVVVIDGKTALVGSMNMDPRSRRLNTEMAVLVHSSAIAQRLIEVYDEVCASSYRVSLAEDKTLRWSSSGPGAPPPATSEPEAGLWLKLAVKLLTPFAPEELL